jgi:hypothetical protein
LPRADQYSVAVDTAQFRRAIVRAPEAFTQLGTDVSSGTSRGARTQTSRLSIAGSSREDLIESAYERSTMVNGFAERHVNSQVDLG